MAKICPITKRGSLMVGGYSNRVRATKYNPIPMLRKQVNLQKKRIFVPELNRTVIMNVSTQGLRTIAKKGPYVALKEAGLLD